MVSRRLLEVGSNNEQLLMLPLLSSLLVLARLLLWISSLQSCTTITGGRIVDVAIVNSAGLKYLLMRLYVRID